MTEFKVGDKVVDILTGNVGVVHQSESTFQFKVIVQELDVYFMEKDGRYSATHKYPRFISLADAKAKGYDVPKQTVKKKITVGVMYSPSNGQVYTKYIEAPQDVVFQDVTFEWEEEQ
jgi:hypothetical protein